MTRTDILIVEDELVVGAAARRILNSEDISVEVVLDVESALPLLAEKDYGVILSDLMLPGASGFDLLEHVIANKPEIPFVLMTGYATVENTAKAFSQGAFDILPKPFDVVELVGTMRRVLRFVDSGGKGRHLEPDSATACDTSGRYYMGEHSWAQIEDDGSVRIGSAESFLNLLDDLEWVELPEVGNDLRQGTRAVRMLSQREEVYRVWSPLTGTVLEVNTKLGENPDLVHQQPHADGWLVRMFPERLGEELKNLRQREWRGP